MVLKNQAPEAKMIQSKFPLDNFCMSFSVCVCVCVHKHIHVYMYTHICTHTCISVCFGNRRVIESRELRTVNCTYLPEVSWLFPFPCDLDKFLKLSLPQVLHPDAQGCSHGW